MTTTKAVFEDFDRLSGNVWLLDRFQAHKKQIAPPNEVVPTKQPDLVILATWMGAAPRHIKKYIVGYRALFPDTSILLIRNDISDVTFRPKQVILRRIQPAVTVVERAMEKKSPNIMIHMYSNGGCNQARILAQQWQEKHSRPLPISSMLLDSCPGIENYGTALAAFIIALPKFFLVRYILLGFIHLVFIVHFVANRIFGAVSFLRRLRKDLNDPAMFPKSAPRIYIYSKTDEMVDWQDVESHAEDAREKGWDVKTERFEGSKHVGHLIADGKRYWNDVQSLV
jgi:hypothetical protein